MSVKEVTMYRIECDRDDCDDSPQEHGDYYAWAQVDGALDEATGSDWFVSDEGEHLCPKHAPRCIADNCNLPLHDREWGDFCEDHAPEPNPDAMADSAQAGPS